MVSHVAREAYMYIALAFHFRPYTSGSKICFCLVFSLIIRVFKRPKQQQRPTTERGV